MVRAAALALAAALAAAAAAAPQSAGIERLRWMQGCWLAAGPTRSVEEVWTVPRGRTMIGTGRTVRGDSTVTSEFVILRETGGVFQYEAHPQGQAPNIFSTRVVSDTMVVFEDAEHDFPQRVGYRRAAGDSLHAWIEGSMGGRPPRRIEFRYGRVACGG